VDILTIGQYLRPSRDHLVMQRFYTPDEFAFLKHEALAMGFRHVESGRWCARATTRGSRPSPLGWHSVRAVLAGAGEDRGGLEDRSRAYDVAGCGFGSALVAAWREWRTVVGCRLWCWLGSVGLGVGMGVGGRIPGSCGR